MAFRSPYHSPVIGSCHSFRAFSLPDGLRRFQPHPHNRKTVRQCSNNALADVFIGNPSQNGGEDNFRQAKVGPLAGRRRRSKITLAVY
jgi:hypothetical protein